MNHLLFSSLHTRFYSFITRKHSYFFAAFASLTLHTHTIALTLRSIFRLDTLLSFFVFHYGFAWPLVCQSHYHYLLLTPVTISSFFFMFQHARTCTRLLQSLGQTQTFLTSFIHTHMYSRTHVHFFDEKCFHIQPK